MRTETPKAKQIKRKIVNELDTSEINKQFLVCAIGEHDTLPISFSRDVPVGFRIDLEEIDPITLKYEDIAEFSRILQETDTGLRATREMQEAPNSKDKKNYLTVFKYAAVNGQTAIEPPENLEIIKITPEEVKNTDLSPYLSTIDID